MISFASLRWEYIHIDEYQDTNTIQYTLAQLLAAKHRNICVVGDMDQAIYAWRGADYRNLWKFTEDYPGAKVVTLEENYRSTQTILAAANQVIAKNVKRQEKKLFTKQGAGEKIKVMLGLTEVEEAEQIAETAQALVRQGIAAEDIAVLYRTNFQSRVLEEAFLRVGVPYQVIGTRFFDRKEIKDLLAFIKTALNPNDIDNLKRIINIPPRGIGNTISTKKMLWNTYDWLFRTHFFG
jgi:DNA helicase-2/ATP-dependent DNA helicase PcrA